MSALPVILLALASPSLAHGHHDELTEEQANAPVDSILWIHIFLQAAVWGVLFPIGMVLGMAKSRWHVPLQVSDPAECSVKAASLTAVSERRICADCRWIRPGTLS